MLAKLNELGGRHGIGRLDMVENRFVGMKSRGVRNPGGAIPQRAHRDLEGVCMDRELLHLRDTLIPRYAEMVYNGYWFAPEREAPAGLHGQGPGDRDRNRAPQAVQGRSLSFGPQASVFALCQTQSWPRLKRTRCIIRPMRPDSSSCTGCVSRHASPF